MTIAATLEKVQTVMTRKVTVDDKTTFASEYDDTLAAYRTLVLNTDEWLDLGSPEQITVTVVPGDTLNP